LESKKLQAIEISVMPLNFHTWYWWSRWRLNGAIFRSCFFRWASHPPGNFSAEALCSHNDRNRISMFLLNAVLIDILFFVVLQW